MCSDNSWSGSIGRSTCWPVLTSASIRIQDVNCGFIIAHTATVCSRLSTGERVVSRTWLTFVIFSRINCPILPIITSGLTCHVNRVTSVATVSHMLSNQISFLATATDSRNTALVVWQNTLSICHSDCDNYNKKCFSECLRRHGRLKVAQA